MYAKIYSMSHHAAYGYYVTQDQLAIDLYISRRSVQRALDSLCKSGLIGYNELYRTGREANGMKSPRSYFAIQEKINAAIEATTPVSASRGRQILDFDFREPAGQADASTCHISAVENSSFQQSAGQADASFCHNDAPSCHNDASFCHNDAPSRRIGATCENVEQDEFTAPSSSWENATKPQENDMPETSNDVYINNNKNNNDNYFSYSSNDPNKRSELSGKNGDCGSGDIGGWSAEVRYVARFIAESSPKHIDGVFLDKTMAAIRDVMDSGAEADEICDAWDLYLDELMNQNSEGGSAAFKRYAMFPLNWLRRADGFRFYLKRIRAKSEKAADASRDTALEADRECSNEAERLAEKYSLTANKTTSGIIWTFMGDYHSAMVAPRAQNRREALRYMCSVKGIEVPKDIEEMSEI
ncbi:hypothetical protein [Collinsella sp. CLA-AA-H302]|uniref:hypothetical protein n=1 Tax=Collinsella sp. CLA-AA-H302 TaxID=3136217 RepID=UPI0032BF6310